MSTQYTTALGQFVFSLQELSYSDSIQHCRDTHGSQLLIIDNENVYTDFKEQFKIWCGSTGQDECKVRIGLSRNLPNLPWEWVDGRRYIDTAYQLPNFDATEAKSDCRSVMMETERVVGYWRQPQGDQTRCTNEKQFVCFKATNTPTTAKATTAMAATTPQPTTTQTTTSTADPSLNSIIDNGRAAIYGLAGALGLVVVLLAAYFIYRVARNKKKKKKGGGGGSTNVTTVAGEVPVGVYGGPEYMEHMSPHGYSEVIRPGSLRKPDTSGLYQETRAAAAGAGAYEEVVGLHQNDEHHHDHTYEYITYNGGPPAPEQGTSSSGAADMKPNSNQIIIESSSDKSVPDGYGNVSAPPPVVENGEGEEGGDDDHISW